MDEPLSNLDAKLRVQMRAEVARIQQQLGTTTLYVTHDQTEAMTLGDRVAVLRDGVLQQLGAPGELYNRPANLFVAGFIGSPAMSLLPARLDGEHLELPFGRAPLADEVRARLRPAPASPVVLAGLRPEHFEDAALTRGEPAALTLRVVPQVVEALGSESFVHFDLEGVPWTGALAAADQAIGLDDLPRHGDAIRRVVARVSAGSRARTGEPLELALRLDRVTLFDATTGASLLMP
jgi:multiple sugar transport system ATP-binding protein